jgi:hypothetical protein
MKKFFMMFCVVVMCALFCGNAQAQFGNVPVPVPEESTDGYPSIECESLEVMLGDASDTIEALKKQIEAKKNRIVQINNAVTRLNVYKNGFIQRGEAVPPGVDDLLDIYLNNWLPKLRQELRELERKMLEATKNWSDLWVQWELAGC